ncbi:MAG: DUF4382 domain-containing protein [Chloroflexia bacterium]|nr:DUF4382 domain-containing protein [Chloroflexia bacterium]
MKLMIRLAAFVAIITLIFQGCKKEDSKVEDQPTGTVTIGITDTRKTVMKAGDDIIDATKLSKFEVTISKIELRDKNGAIVEALASSTTLDLRNYQGNVNKLSPANVAPGTYTGVLIYFSGVSITYDGNNYTASTENAPSVTISDYATSTGIPNPFSGGDIEAEVPFDFEVAQDSSTIFNITFDVVASCYEIAIDCPICDPVNQYFAGLRSFFEKICRIILKRVFNK